MVDLNQSQHSESLVPSGGQKVLLIHQDKSALHAVHAALEGMDVHIYDTRTEKDANTYLHHPTPPDVIIMQQGMREFSTTELCQRLRANARLAHIYILLLSHQSTFDRSECLIRGADDFLVMPFEKELFQATLRAGLRTQAIRKNLVRRERRRAISWLGNVINHEINNPLTAALVNLELLKEELKSNAEQANLVGESLEMLDRIKRATSRLRKNKRTKRTTIRHTNQTEFKNTLKAKASSLSSEVKFDFVIQDDGVHYFDQYLLVDAVEKIIKSAKEYCSGQLHVSAHWNKYRLAIVIELARAPDIDPAVILEPRLWAPDGQPPQFDAALSLLEERFSDAGGQIYARTMQGRWRFGLTLPVYEEPHEKPQGL